MEGHTCDCINLSPLCLMILRCLSLFHCNIVQAFQFFLGGGGSKISVRSIFSQKMYMYLLPQECWLTLIVLEWSIFFFLQLSYLSHYHCQTLERWFLTIRLKYRYIHYYALKQICLIKPFWTTHSKSRCQCDDNHHKGHRRLTVFF